ncbi:MAG: CsbD family protein [Reyranellaceae bacterium]
MRTSGTADKVIGTANQAIGKAIQGFGALLGSERLKRRGIVQEARGDAQVSMGKVKDEAGPVHH